MTTLTIILCKFLTALCKLFGKNGTVFPGSIALKVNKKVLNKINYPKYVIGVTGSSGKGSTVNMIAHILKTSKKKVIYNASGSNINSGIATLVLNNVGILNHTMDADVLLLEMDERYISKTFEKGIITHLIITNVTRDQPSRNYHPDIIFDKIMESIDEKTHLVINVDDPLINRAKFLHGGKITTYGIEETKYDSKTVPNYAIDSAYCPKCHTKLKYSSYHYGNEGIYECPKCDFDRKKPDFAGTDVNLEEAYFKENNKKYNLDKKVFFAVYYTLAAISICKTIGLSEEEISNAINKNPIKSKRLESYTIASRKFETLESKNENALSYLQSLNYIMAQDGKKTVIMGFDNVSRRYSYNDLSWLWDVNFELLCDESVDKIFCVGRFKYDVACRLDYANIDRDKVVLVDNINTLIENIIENSKGDIYSMVCFDMTEIITNLIKEASKNEKNN